jgi:pimeloyl-ACP methyl ester carboxylesterase
MRPKQKRLLLLASAAVAAAAVCAAAYLVWRHATSVRRFAYGAQSLAQQDYAALGSHPAWRTSSFDVSPGVTLHGLERVSARSGAPMVIFFTGNDAHPLAEGQRFLEALCRAGDWSGAVWAYRGFDGSGGAPEPRALIDDGWKAYIRATAAQTAASGRVHVVGFSLGTSIVAAIAARAGSTPPASITLLGPLKEIDMTFAQSAVRHRYVMLKYLDAVQAPALVIHGHRDQVLPVEWGREIAARLGARARYVEPSELGHLDLALAPQVLDEVRAFIERH